MQIATQCQFFKLIGIKTLSAPNMSAPEMQWQLIQRKSNETQITSRRQSFLLWIKLKPLVTAS
jgi:hypothetical protein